MKITMKRSMTMKISDASKLCVFYFYKFLSILLSISNFCHRPVRFYVAVLRHFGFSRLPKGDCVFFTVGRSVSLTRLTARISGPTLAAPEFALKLAVPSDTAETLYHNSDTMDN